MKIGMLWFDDDSKTTIEEKIRSAVEYYSAKYHKIPNICFIHPSMMPKEGVSADGISVVESKIIRPNYFHIGTIEQEVADGVL